MSTTDTIAAWYGANRLHRDQERIAAFWNGEGRAMVSCTLQNGFYRQLSLAEMRTKAPEHLRRQASLPGCNLPELHADFGTISTARYWGGTVIFGEGGKPHLEPVAADIAAALEAPRAATDDPQQDAAQAAALYQQVCADLNTSDLWLRTPDMQGALTTAALVVDQTGLMMDMLDRPDLVLRFLDHVVDHLIDFQDLLRSAAPHRVCGNIWPWVHLPAALGIGLTEDYMPLLSPDQYATFGIPGLRRFAERYHGLLIHCCGSYGHHVPTLAASGLPIRAIEFHHPFTTVEQLAPLAAQGVVLIPYLNGTAAAEFGTLHHFYRHLLRTTTWRYWFPVFSDTADLDFAEEMTRLGPELTGRTSA